MRIQYSYYVASVLKPLKRKIIILLLCIILVLIFRHKFTCSKNNTKIFVEELCLSYASGESVGVLCRELCASETTLPLSCHTLTNGKDLVFSGSWRHTNVLFKSVKQTITPAWLETLSPKKIEQQFFNNLKYNIKLNFNITIQMQDAQKLLLYVPNYQQLEKSIRLSNVWSLLQDREYLALNLYESFDVFPKVLGTCGSMYAVEKFDSVSGFSHLITLYESQEDWINRVKISIMIMDLLLHLDQMYPEPLMICNLRISEFGITPDFKRVIYLSPNSAYPVSVASKMTGNGSPCKKHSDCDLFGCRSFCNLVTLRCQHGVVNNNLQLVCEKIFLGWVMSGRVMVPGLLMGPRSPQVLVEILEICANPMSETGTPRAAASMEIRNRLYKLLVHLK